LTDSAWQRSTWPVILCPRGVILEQLSKSVASGRHWAARDADCRRARPDHSLIGWLSPLHRGLWHQHWPSGRAGTEPVSGCRRGHRPWCSLASAPRLAPRPPFPLGSGGRCFRAPPAATPVRRARTGRRTSPRSHPLRRQGRGARAASPLLVRLCLAKRGPGVLCAFLSARRNTAQQRPSASAVLLRKCGPAGLLALCPESVLPGPTGTATVAHQDSANSLARVALCWPTRHRC
jgi:hypothetical protein